MNKVILIGRLVRDPELKYTSSNIACSLFTLAVNRNFTNQDGEREADFINVQVWKNQAENVKKYLTKGSQVAIDGRIQVRSFEDKDGNKRYVTEVVAENIQFLDSKKEGQPSAEEPKTQSDPYKEMGEQVKAEFSYEEDDLPF